MKAAESDPEVYLPTLPLDRCPLRQPIYVELRDRQLVLVRTSAPDRVFCADCRCPHAGASLANGELSGLHLICPQHHLRFDLVTGACEGCPRLGLNRYPTRIRDGMVYVRLRPELYRPRADTT